jgi:hypothetical protein
MSKQRSISIRLSDQIIAEAFEVALAQVGVRFHTRHMPFISITGNKDDGMVEVKTAQSSARVYCHGKGEHFFYVDHITFDEINGQKQENSRVVWFHDLGGNRENLLVALMQLTQHRDAVIYQVLGLAEGFHTAPSIMYALWKYPLVKFEDEDIKLIYELDCCGITKIELTYNHNYGFTEAVINGTRYFTCKPFAGTWSEHV